MSYTILQNLVLSPSSCRESHDSNALLNLFDVKSWRENTTLHDLFLCLKGTGELEVKIALHHSSSLRVLVESKIRFSDDVYEFSIPDSNMLDGGLLVVSALKIDDAEVEAIYYATNTPPKNIVKLGMVIPHFDKKNYVLPIVEKLRNILSDDKQLIIIDNSNNLTEEEVSGATLIPGTNVCGCSGGFMRGLLHLIDDKSFTHCLFLDDDGIFDAESVLRTYAILQFAKTERLAVSATFFIENESNIIHEKGGIADFPWRSLHRGVDIRNVDEVAKILDDSTKPDYGAFWFFAFALKDVQHFIFPFFIRGEDVLFSISNQLNVVTPLGISCYGPNFIKKDSAMSRYFDLRSQLVLVLSGIIDKKKKDVLQEIENRFLELLYGMEYGSANALRLALSDVMKGGKFWSNHRDITEIRSLIQTACSDDDGDLNDFTTWQLIEFDDVKHSNKWVKSLHKRMLTFSNEMCFTFKNRQQVLHSKDHFLSRNKSMRFQRIYYTFSGKREPYVREWKQVRFKQEMHAFQFIMKKLAHDYDALRLEYKKLQPELTSEKFWRTIYPS